MVRRLFSCFLGMFLLFLALPAFAEKPLTNEDVIKLSKVGIGDEVIAAKIRQAAEVDFRLETDDLAKLKAAGVSGRIIAAMLDRSSEPEAASPAGPAAAHVKLVEGDKVIPLASMLGEPSSTYVYVTMLFWDNFPGLHATVRASDREPEFLITTDQDPRSRYAIVRLDINDKDGDRSLKMGRSGAFSFKASNAPDSDWTFPFDSKEEKRGTWRLSLRKPLPPGEYGVFVVQQGELFDFGVD